MNRAIRMNQVDQVATVLNSVMAGDEVNICDANNNQLYGMVAAEDIPFGNKIALCDILAGEFLIKYGVPVGIVTRKIRCGHLVHVHNVKSRTVDIPPSIRREIMRQMHITEGTE